MSTSSSPSLAGLTTGSSDTSMKPCNPAPAPLVAIPCERLIHEDELPGGAMGSWVLKRGQVLRLTDIEGKANVGAIAFNRHDFLDRYNMADTLKAQHTAKLTTGYLLLSDMGRVLLSITADTVGWHDPLGGHGNAGQLAKKYGPSRFQEQRNAWHRNARDAFIIELGKWGLGKRDLIPNVNFFSRLAVDSEGRISYVAGNSHAGAFIDLRAEMDVLIVLNSCPHPLDTAPVYTAGRVKVSIWQGDAPGADDICRNYRPENARAFQNSEMLFR